MNERQFWLVRRLDGDNWRYLGKGHADWFVRLAPYGWMRHIERLSPARISIQIATPMEVLHAEANEVLLPPINDDWKKDNLR